MNVSKGNYGQYSSSNYGANSIYIYVGSLKIYFSYDTVVAFSNGWSNLVVSENIWGPTTGKHLNWINSDHSVRLDRNEFEDKLKEVLKEHSLEV